MDEIKKTIAGNLIMLRKRARLTQLELAEKLNYSDKAVSKWERGESVPDISVLKRIAELFGVTVDYLIQSEHPDEEYLGNGPKEEREDEATGSRQQRNVNRMVVALLAVSLVWLIATIVFVILKLYPKQFDKLWSVYIYAVPISCVVMLVFNSIWGRPRINYLIVSLLVWSLLFSLYVGFYQYNMKLLFVIGIPAQIIIILWSCLKKRG